MVVGKAIVRLLLFTDPTASHIDTNSLVAAILSGIRHLCSSLIFNTGPAYVVTAVAKHVFARLTTHKTPHQASNLIGDWEDLAYCHDPAYKEHDELKAWLRSQTQDLETTVSTTSHPLEMLRAALQAATNEIRDNLDEQIYLLVKEAIEYNIQVHTRDYYKTRVDDWDGMLPTDIDEMGAEECVSLMRAARDEIAWQLCEISRLECYISVEKQMQNHGVEGRSTMLRPLDRKSKEYSDSPRRGRFISLRAMDSGLAFSPTSPDAG